VRAGARVVLVAVGGSATTDGGAGALEAIDAAGGLGGAKLVVLCDVRTVFEDAPRVFGPQKGADQEMVGPAARAPRRAGRAAPARPARGADDGLRRRPLGGLVGGARRDTGAGCALGARRAGLRPRMRAARAVVTGEGKLDEQTLEGKLVGEIGTRARQAGVPLHAIVGTDALDPFGKRIIDLQRTLEATTLEQLEAAGETLGRELAEGLA
jgi:glycerate kinase